MQKKTYRATRKDDNKLTPPASAKSYDGLMLYMDMEGKSQLYPVNMLSMVTMPT